MEIGSFAAAVADNWESGIAAHLSDSPLTSETSAFAVADFAELKIAAAFVAEQKIVDFVVVGLEIAAAFVVEL